MSPAEQLKWLPGATPERTIAQDQHNSYVVIRESRSSWLISAWDNSRFQSIPRLSGTTAPTRTLARAIAAEYSALGADFRSHEYGHQERATVAITAAYDRERAGRLGEPGADTIAPTSNYLVPTAERPQPMSAVRCSPKSCSTDR